MGEVEVDDDHELVGVGVFALADRADTQDLVDLAARVVGVDLVVALRFFDVVVGRELGTARVIGGSPRLAGPAP